MADDIKFEFGAKDTASAVIDKMVADIVEQQKRLSAAFKASGVEVRGFDDAVKDTTSSDTKDLAKRIGIGDVVDGFSKARKHAEGLNRTIAAFIPAVGGLVAAAGAIGIGHLFTGWTDAAADLQRNAQSMGVSVDRLSTAQNALRLTGASAEAASSGLSGLQQTMRGALFSGDAQSAGLFRGLGIDIGSFNGGARRALDVIPQVANAVQRLYRAGNPDAAVNLLSKVGLSPEWLTVLKDGAAGWDKYNEAAYRAGHVTQQQADAAKELQQEQTRLGIALETFGYQVAGEVAPDLVPIIKHMSEWVEKNRDWLAQDMAGALKGVLNYVASGEWAKLSGSLVNIIGQFGSWTTAIEKVGAAWEKNAPTAKLIADLGVLAVLPIPPWIKLLLAIGGDSANNPEANAARDSQIDKDATDYLAAHPYRDFPAEAAGQNGFGENPGPRVPMKRFSPAVAKDLPPEARALLDAIAGGESGGDYSKVNPASGAFGRYQFLGSTWSETAEQTRMYGQTPENQDRNAWFLAQQRYQAATNGRDLLTDLKAGRDPSRFLAPTWPSLPGGSQPNIMTPSFSDRLHMNMQRPEVTEPKTPTSTASRDAAPPANADDRDSDHSGRVRLEVIHRDPPAGVSLQVTPADGSNVQVDGPKVETSMPGAQQRNVARDGF